MYLEQQDDQTRKIFSGEIELSTWSLKEDLKAQSEVCGRQNVQTLLYVRGTTQRDNTKRQFHHNASLNLNLVVPIGILDRTFDKNKCPYHDNVCFVQFTAQACLLKTSKKFSKNAEL